MKYSLDFFRKPTLPPLAWIAICKSNSKRVTVLHGTRVEIGDDWFFEGVWDGPFRGARFAESSIVFGSGARCGSDGIQFVSSCATVDRLQYVERRHEIAVSNSLACLFWYEELKPNYAIDYYTQLGRVVDGTLEHEIAAHPTPVTLVYAQNLLVNEGTIHTQSKPDLRVPQTYDEYIDLLESSVYNLLENAHSPKRSYPLRAISTLSSGYDSTAVTSILTQFGLSDAITITRARGGEQDSGTGAGRALNIHLHQFRRNEWRNKAYPEPLFIAADAKGEDIYFAGIPSTLLEGSVLFTAYHGDVIWGNKPYRPYQRGDRSGLSLTEFRLARGFVHAPLPFINFANVEALRQISGSSEMANWDIGGTYNRPIPRRIAEERGVPRNTFGLKKKAASVLFREPAISPWTMLSRRSYLNFTKWLWKKSKNGEIPLRPHEVIGLLTRQVTVGVLARIGISMAQRLPRKLGRFWEIVNKLNAWGKTQDATKYLFPWAMERAVTMYSQTDRPD